MLANLPVKSSCSKAAAAVDSGTAQIFAVKWHGGMRMHVIGRRRDAAYLAYPTAPSRMPDTLHAPIHAQRLYWIRTRTAQYGTRGT